MRLACVLASSSSDLYQFKEWAKSQRATVFQTHLLAFKDKLQFGNANNLPFEDNYFDLVISINTFHCLEAPDLELALKEMERVGKSYKYLCVESYRNELEKANLLYWQVSCEAFNTPNEWLWWFKQSGYFGDYSFIYFE